MGLVDWFIKRRMAKESAAALSPDQQQVTALQQAAMQQGQVTQISGLSDVGALISQWQQFQQMGGAQMSSQVFDLRGSGAREEILAAVQKHGVPTDGTAVIGMAGAVDYDPQDMMGLQSDILGVLAKHGIDLEQMGVQQVPGAPPPATPTDEADLPPIRNPLNPLG